MKGETEVHNGFSDLLSEPLDIILSAALEQTLLSGDVLFHEGDEGGTLFVIDSGSIEVFKTIHESFDRVLITIKQGGVLGEMSFVDGSRRSAGARAIEPTQVRMLTRPAFDAFAKDHPEIAAQFSTSLSHIMAERVRLTNELYRQAMLDWLEATHADSLNLQQLAEGIRMVSVHLTTGAVIRGRLVEFVNHPAGWVFMLKDEAGQVSLVPYHAMARIDVLS